MINSADIAGTTNQNFLFFKSPETTPDPASDMQVNTTIRKARAILSAQKKMNPRALNLIQMAETALKNGNPVSAQDFAGKVLSMLSIKDSREILKKTPPRPESFPGKQVEESLKKSKQKEHTYQDASNDPGVSFSYPGNLTGPESFLAVPAHEYEHVRSSLQDAILNGENVRVYVSYKVRYDPSTGDPYMAGGVTRTIRFRDIPVPEKGKKVDLYV
ncbi:MAG: hypothetical protein JXJ04_08800 [Spirochaetales bacterium]|nr:hypothetical protein [Spirochaetales bacterium]